MRIKFEMETKYEYNVGLIFFFKIVCMVVWMVITVKYVICYGNTTYRLLRTNILICWLMLAKWMVMVELACVGGVKPDWSWTTTPTIAFNKMVPFMPAKILDLVQHSQALLVTMASRTFIHIF
ncbi:MAG: hypothetical protein H6543_03030 [Prevotellaceae bacterium]|nr:hypothetical protein [Prevotellaceae bacterium]